MQLALFQFFLQVLLLLQQTKVPRDTSPNSALLGVLFFQQISSWTFINMQSFFFFNCFSSQKNLDLEVLQVHPPDFPPSLSQSRQFLEVLVANWSNLQRFLPSLLCTFTTQNFTGTVRREVGVTLVVLCKLFHRLSSSLTLFFNKATTKGTVERSQEVLPPLRFTHAAPSQAVIFTFPLFLP